MMSSYYIIYNLLYSRREKRFTIEDLVEDLAQRGISVTFGKVLKVVERLISIGQVSQRVGYFVSYI